MKLNLAKNKANSIIIVAISVLIVVVVLGLVGRIKSNKQQGPLVLTTIYPIYDILVNVAGDKVTVDYLLKPGASPHNYDLSPRQAKTLADADQVVVIGLGLDDWALNSVSEDRLLNLSTAVNLRYYGPNSPDPHYWLSPENGVLIAHQLAASLAELVPDEADYFYERADEFISNLRQADTLWREKLFSLNNWNLFVYHDAWDYLADHYALKVIASLEPPAGKELSPKYLDSVLAIIRESNTEVLFIEPQQDPDSALAYTQGLVNKTAVLDPLGGVETRQSYLSLLNYNIETIYQALVD